MGADIEGAYSEVDVLGQKYKIIFVTKEEMPMADGECDFFAKTIKVRRFLDILEGERVENAIKHLNMVLRHEIMHAFFYESGLSEYAYDETLVDWFANQFPKIAMCSNAFDVHKSAGEQDE